MAMELEKIALYFLSPSGFLKVLGAKSTFHNQLQRKVGKIYNKDDKLKRIKGVGFFDGLNHF